MFQLGLVKNIVESVGMGISYAYEDLVFLEHNSFLLQFTVDDRQVLIHVNSAADRDEIGPDIDRLVRAASQNGMEFVTGTAYTINEQDDETITIEFDED